MTITFEGAGTADGGNTNSVTPTLPTVSADDIAVVLSSHGAATATVISLSTPSGYTAQTQVASNDRETRVFHKIMVGGDANPNVTADTTQGFIANVAVFDGIDTSTPLDVTIGSSTGDGSATMTAPSITTVTNGCMILRMFCSERGFAAAHSGHSEGMVAFNDYSNPGYDNAISMTYQLQGTMGATGTATATAEAAGAWVAYTLALRPAGAALALNHDAYNASGYSPESVFVLGGIDGSIGAGDTWEFVSGTSSGGTWEDLDYGDFTFTPPAGGTGAYTIDWIHLDTDDAEMSVTGAVDNGSGLVRLTITGHGLVTDDGIYVENIGGITGVNELGWKVTKIDDNTLDLQGSTFSGTYTSGGDAIEVGYATHTHTIPGAAGPEFTGTVPNQIYTVDTEITTLALTGYFAPTPDSFSSVGTALPTGLSLDTDTGEITGTPTTAGVTTGVQIRGTDGSGNDDTNTFTITVNPRYKYVPFRRS